MKFLLVARTEEQALQFGNDSTKLKTDREALETFSPTPQHEEDKTMGFKSWCKRSHTDVETVKVSPEFDLQSGNEGVVSV